MKQYTLAGFNAIVTIDGEIVSVTVNGKTVKQKKGNFELTCTETEGAFDGAEVGKSYAFTTQSLIDSAPDETEAETTETEAPVQTEAEIQKAANRAKLKELKGVADGLQKAMSAGLAELTSGKLTSDAFAQKYALPFAAANTAYAEFKASISGNDTEPAKEKTPAEISSENAIAAHKEIIAKHEAELTAHNETLAKMIAAHNETEGFSKIGKKGKRGAHSGEKSSVTIDYDMAQEIRKHFASLTAAGKSFADAIKETAEKFDVKPQAVKYKVTYRQNLLRKGDTMYIPFDNAYYNRYEGEKLTVCFPDRGSFTLNNNEWHAKKPA